MRTLILLALIVFSSTVALAQPYQLGKPTFSGAAVEAAGSGYALRGTLGEAGIIGQASNGSYSLRMGYWSEGAGSPVVAVDPETPSALELDLRAVPNPFNPATEFRFNQPRPGSVQVRVYNIAGRVVRTLDAGPRSAGPQAVRWNGTDDEGRGVGSGSYFARLMLDGQPVGPTLKIGLVK